MRAGENNSRPVECLDKPGGDYADNSFVPVGVIYNRGIAARKAASRPDHVQGLLGNPPVNAFPFVVVLIDFCADSESRLCIRRRKQLYSHPSGLHSSCSIDTRAYLEHDVVNRDMCRFKPGKLNHGKKSLTRLSVELLQAVMGKYAVLSRHGYKVRGYAHHKQIKQWDE